MLEPIKEQITKIEETNYDELTNGKALKEIDFQDLRGLVDVADEKLAKFIDEIYEL